MFSKDIDLGIIGVTNSYTLKKKGVSVAIHFSILIRRSK